MSKTKKCIGFGEFRGKCGRTLAVNSPYWCAQCDELRMQQVDAALKHLAVGFDEMRRKREGGAS